jgi:NapH/MauN family ferredoxin-type protein
MRLQLKRSLFQFFVFLSANLGALGVKTGFCYPFFYCHACPASTSACPLRAIEQSVYKQSITLKFLLFPFLILGFFGVTTGRALCGWACPIGFLQRGTARVARKLKRYPLIRGLNTQRLDSYMRYAKYVVLIGLVVLTSAFFGFLFTDICPVGFLTGTIPVLILNPGKFVPNPFFWIAFAIFLLFFLLIFMVERGWCRYFCPLGAILAPFNKISFLHISVNTDECIHCNACSQVCPMGIDVPTMHRDPECILCGKCISACPRNLISYKRI